MADKEYIDRAPFIGDLNDMKKGYYAISIDEMVKALANAPAFDVVDVCRCKDCKHCVDYLKDGNMWCMRPIYSEDYEETGEIYPLQVPVTDHCFCSYGKRKEATP